jgi:hypothetical protein
MEILIIYARGKVNDWNFKGRSRTVFTTHRYGDRQSFLESIMEKHEAGSASGLFNMMRNMGGSIGIAALATLVTQREQFHFWVLKR